MNPRILVALVSATLLAGCGFSDSSNYAGGAFLDAQGESVSPRAEASLGASTRSVEYLPPEGYPDLPGTNPTVIGTIGKDSVRVIVGFNLQDPKTWGGPDTLKKRPIKALTFELSSSSWSSKLRVRFLLSDKKAKGLSAMLMGVDPMRFADLKPLLDTVVTATADADGLFSIPVSPKVSDSIIASSVDGRGYLTLLLDPLVGTGTSDASLAYFRAEPNLTIDSLPAIFAGKISGGSDDTLTAIRSVQLRAEGSSAEVIGWWAGSGRRARLELDGEAVRASLHRQVSANDITAETDNSYHVLQARASLGMSSFVSSFSAPRMVLISRVIEREDSSRAILGKPVSLPSSVLTTEEAGIPGALDVKCDEFVTATLVNCSVQVGGVTEPYYTRMANAISIPYSKAERHFWLRTDVPDQVEFAALNNLRVTVRSETSGLGSSQLWIKWTRLHSSQSFDYQNDSSGIRAKATLAPGQNSTELEIRSALSQVILQKKRKVVLEVVPMVSNRFGIGLWTAQPASPNRLIDSVHVLLRPRDGRNF